MKAVIQRVSSARVEVGGQVVSSIERGILTLLGVETGDSPEQARKLAAKIAELRIFEDDAGKMNLSLKDISGEHLVVSQFTLAGDTSTGRRPSFGTAEKPLKARAIYEDFLKFSEAAGVPTRGGVFQADMKVTLTNDGPVTFIL
jgi:D-tyrosyl-tRNA(Tyr) deacylase